MGNRQIKQLANTMRDSVSLLGCLIALLALSCSSVPTTVVPLQTFPITYSFVFIIHGDGDYLYHDRDGNAYQADERTLAEAIDVAVQNPNAEVFIFHEKSKSHTLLFFSRRDGEFYYYRNGVLVSNESYWRDKPGFATQAELYRRYKQAPSPETVKLFLYFGHEIPEAGGEGYDASYPERSFTIRDLRFVLGKFTTDSAIFDLAILSTCFNGTPYTIDNVSEYARYIIASPDNLHLSYFDLAPLKRLEADLTKETVPDFAKRFGQQAFNKLAPEIQTAITVAVYDVGQVKQYVGTVSQLYAERLTSLRNTSALAEHCDCADEPAFTQPQMSKGVYILYRPPHFGRAKNKLTHSGWECWKPLVKPQIN